VDPKSGVLTFSSTFNSGVSNLAPFQSIIDPTGRFLYITNSDAAGNNVVGLATDTTNFDGSLTPIPGSPFLVGMFPVGIAEDPAGKYVYVVNNTDATISGFSVGANGALNPLSTPTFPTGSGPATSFPGFPAIDPTGGFLYVPNSGDGTISVFSIAPTTGLLTEITGSPFSTGVGSSPTMAAITPSNKYLYVTDAANNKIIGFTIGAGGALSGNTTGSPYATGNLPQGFAIDVSSAFLVVANSSDNTLTYYSVDSTTGKLTVGQTVQTRSVPLFVNLLSGTAAPVIAPATVEAANSGTSNDISSYTVNAGTGALTAAATSPTAGVAGNNQVSVSQTGTFFYTASTSALKLGAFSVNGSAALTALTGSPADLGGDTPAGVYADPSDQFLYVGDSTANVIIGFTNSSGTISTGTPSASLVSVNAIAGDSQASLIFAMGAAQIKPAIIDSASGTLAAGNTLVAAGNWTAGAIDPSGRFLIAADSTGHQISSFAIQPVTGSTSTTCTPVPPASPADGCLTLVPSSTIAIGTGLNGPYAVTFDPLGRFVFVADEATGNIAVFAFDSSTGLTTAAGSPVTVDAGGVSNVAVDANGKYLYVGIKGNGTTIAGKVAVYTLGSNGALTAGTPVDAAIGTSAVTVTNSIN